MQLVTVREMLYLIFNVANRNYLIDNQVPVFDHQMEPDVHVLIWIVLILPRKKPEKSYTYIFFFLYVGKFKLKIICSLSFAL